MADKSVIQIGMIGFGNVGQGVYRLLEKNRSLIEAKVGAQMRIKKIVVRAYEPAFHIIGDPHKRDPHTRQSADHSMLYLVCTMLRKALELGAKDRPNGAALTTKSLGWKNLMLLPHDFDKNAINHPVTRELMGKMEFAWGGPDYDKRYPDGIPTSMLLTDEENEAHDSGLVMYPAGHARNTTADLKDILNHKWKMLGALAFEKPEPVIAQISSLEKKAAADVARLYAFDILDRGTFE